MPSSAPRQRRSISHVVHEVTMGHSALSAIAHSTPKAKEQFRLHLVSQLDTAYERAIDFEEEEHCRKLLEANGYHVRELTDEEEAALPKMPNVRQPLPPLLKQRSHFI